MSLDESASGKAKRRDGDLDTVVKRDQTSDIDRPSPGQLSATMLLDDPDRLPHALAPGKVATTSLISRKASAGTFEEDASDKLRRAQGASGDPLPAELRAELEAAIGQSLDRVRIHTDSAAAEAASALAARAFATGPSIYFASGAYDPASSKGRELIAHEVAHTVQSPQATGDATRVSSPGDAHELEADGFASAFASGAAPAALPTAGSAAPAISRHYNDAELRRAAEGREFVLVRIEAARNEANPRQALNALLRTLRQLRRRHQRDTEATLVNVPIYGTPRPVRVEDLDLLIGRVESALADVRRGSEPRTDDPSGERPDGAPDLSERDRERIEEPPSTLMMADAEASPEIVARILTHTRAFGARFPREIANALRRNGIQPGNAASRIHYLSTDEFRAIAREQLLSLFEPSERTPELTAIVESQVETMYGITDDDTHQSYVDQEHAETSHRIHEAVHLVESERFVRATEDPSNLQLPAHHVAFHEAATSYITMVIVAQNGMEYHEDYPAEAVQIAARVAARVGNDAFFRAYMTGNMSAIVSAIPLFDQLLEGFYRGDVPRMNAAFAGRPQNNVHPNDQFRPMRQRPAQPATGQTP